MVFGSPCLFGKRSRPDGRDGRQRDMDATCRADETQSRRRDRSEAEERPLGRLTAARRRGPPLTRHASRTARWPTGRPRESEIQPVPQRPYTPRQVRLVLAGDAAPSGNALCRLVEVRTAPVAPPAIRRIDFLLQFVCIERLDISTTRSGESNDRGASFTDGRPQDRTLHLGRARHGDQHFF